MHEHGAAGTRLDDVRAATGTSKSQLYHYFRDKSALVGALIRWQVQRVLQPQQPELGGIDSMSPLRRWRDRVVELNRQAVPRGCPIGRLASELAESDPAARADPVRGFATWEGGLAAGLRRMQDSGERDADPNVNP
jgi:TetR/AcrR family transcriptional repressor of nem operon